MHVLPRVRELHERFSDILTVIGVHAGKFRAERDTARIATARERLGVTHPVVNDKRFRVWRAYAVTAWPTVALIGPDGRLLGRVSGEFDVDSMADELTRAASAYADEGTLRPGPEPFEAAPLPAPSGTLRFPTRALAGEAGTLFVSDAGHHRVLEAALTRDAGSAVATVTRVWGDGTAGFADGPAEAARFEEPRGLALLGGALFVADRANHAVRRLDLAAGEVATVAGNGSLAAHRISEGDARTPLRSPWDLLSADDRYLLVAMAGSHQLYSLSLAGGDGPRLRLEAGTGAEDIRDGDARSAALAQPTGLAAGPSGEAHFVDCESSSVRSLEAGSVRTLVGTGLFDYGDRDGPPADALLQHAEDVALFGGSLAVADTYNDKVRLVDPVSGRTRTMAGDAGSGALSGPAGIASLGETLLVCDTDAHRLVEVDADGALADVAFEW